MISLPANGNGPPPTPRRVPAVLVVEDEDNLRAVIRRLFQGDGYSVLDHEVELVLTAQLMDMRLVCPQLAFLAKPFRNDALSHSERAARATGLMHSPHNSQPRGLTGPGGRTSGLGGLQQELQSPVPVIVVRTEQSRAA